MYNKTLLPDGDWIRGVIYKAKGTGKFNSNKHLINNNYCNETVSNKYSREPPPDKIKALQYNIKSQYTASVYRKKH